eukprot:TRINITY_DN837_c0_g1_i1.p1 TRINITY_DN837_c0_g1~~TRINITY_DN837_c0_g1_i1.p1  ORF type:complete len:793 (-),score=239.64 TRINITY_DN837_c0_g1_i1:73-2451(-)
MASQEAHRSGPWKQSNKGHKTGRHRSKGAVEKINRGRVSVKVCSKKGVKVQRRVDRKNQLMMARNQARQEALAKKRSLGGAGSPPILVAVVPLSETQEEHVKATMEKINGAVEESQVVSTGGKIHHLQVPRFKQRFSLIAPRFDSLYEILDATKVCDSVIFLLCPHTGMSERGELILSSVLAQSIPTDPIVLLGSPDEIPPNKMNEVKKLMVKALERKFPVEKVHTLQTDSEAVNLVRTLGSQKRKSNVMRERRGNLIAESVKYIPGADLSDGCLELTGFVRGADISVNRLVHVPGLGDFQLDRIEKLQDPCPMARRNDMEEVKVLKPDEGQEDLETENAPDGMDGEQTWPTEEELQEAEQNALKKTKRVPKGTSEYQAAWILEEEEEGAAGPHGDNDQEEDDSDMEEDDMDNLEPPLEEEGEDSDQESGDDYEADEAMENMSVTESTAGNTEDYDKKHVNFSEEVNEMERIKQERMEAMFPDEIDTPMDTHARIRFQKYRGLKSFRTSAWDKKENLPYDYARIFQFENFLRTRKRVLSEELAEGTYAEVGWYVKVVLKGVGAHLKTQFEGRVLSLVSLLPHEHRMSVVNLAVRRAQISHKLPVKSKTHLIFQCGWRRFGAGAIFSQHTTGSKHKYERFFREGSTVVMTTFAPIMFPPAPVLVFQDLPGQGHTLLATGTFLNADPDRLVIKRTILSGHPYRVHKKTATVRFMFFNREDINWFKPIELKSKQGRRGHIKEPLGTHGHMKCIFDGQMSQQDTVMLNLYKRVFPKWTYDPYPMDPEQVDMDKMDS